MHATRRRVGTNCTYALCQTITTSRANVYANFHKYSPSEITTCINDAYTRLRNECIDGAIFQLTRTIVRGKIYTSTIFRRNTILRSCCKVAHHIRLYVVWPIIYDCVSHHSKTARIMSRVMHLCIYILF